MASMVSSVRRPLVRGSAPVADSSSSIQPTPRHIRTRPFERTSTVAIRLARTTAWWFGTTRTPVARVIREVTAARKAIRSSGSGMRQSSGSGIRPDEA